MFLTASVAVSSFNGVIVKPLFMSHAAMPLPHKQSTKREEAVTAQRCLSVLSLCG